MWHPDLRDLVPPARWPELGLLELIVLFLIGVGLFCAASLAWGQGAGFGAEACRSFARFAFSTATIRDVGADRDLHLASVRRSAVGQGMELLPIFERELLRVYAEKLAAERAEESAYQRCMTGEILRRDG